MSGYAEVTTAVFGQVNKLVKPLSDEEMKRVASGESKVALVAAGQQIVEKGPVLTAALKLQGQLSDEETKRAASGESKIALVAAGQQIVEKGPVLTAALKLLGQLSATELRDIEEGRAKIAFIPKGAKIDYQFDPTEVAAQLVKLEDVSDVVAFLDADSRLGIPNLKKIASVLNIAIPTSVKAKPDVQLHIARSVVRDRGLATVR